MKKQSSSKSGFINSRNLVGVLLCSAAISLAMLSFAATPTNQKATAQKPAIKPPTIGKQLPPNPAAGPDAPPLAAPTPTGATLTSANIGSANALTYADSVGSALNLTFFA